MREIRQQGWPRKVRACINIATRAILGRALSSWKGKLHCKTCCHSPRNGHQMGYQRSWHSRIFRLVVRLHGLRYSGQVLPYYKGRLKTRLRLSSGHSLKWDSSLKTIRPQSALFPVDRAWHHCYQTRRYSCMRSKRYNGRWENKFCSFYHVPRVMLDT